MKRARVALLATVAAAVTAVAGCGEVTLSEGDPCRSDGACPNPTTLLACVYGTCRSLCGGPTDLPCHAARECTCSAGWEPVGPGIHGSGPHGACLPTCASDTDCASMRRLRFIQTDANHTETQFQDAPGFCGPDHFCHESCPGLKLDDFCDNLLEDRCTDVDGGAPICLSPQDFCD